MAKNYYYIDDATAQGPNTLLAIENESARFGIGTTTSIGYLRAQRVAQLAKKHQAFQQVVDTLGNLLQVLPIHSSRWGSKLSMETALIFKIQPLPFPLWHGQ
jgi:hypothetical protein